MNEHKRRNFTFLKFKIESKMNLMKKLNLLYWKIGLYRKFIKLENWNKEYTLKKKVTEFPFTENNVYGIHTGCIVENEISEK